MPVRRQSVRSLPVLAILTAVCLGMAGCSIGIDGPDGFVRDWLVLEPIPVAPRADQAPDDDTQQAAFAHDWLQDAGGEASVQPRAGAALTIDGTRLVWRYVRAKDDTVNLQHPRHTVEYAVAYAYAEFDVPEARSAYLGVGSDDAVKVWLNGKLVHENRIERGLRLDDDLIAVDLKRGKNRLLLKVQNGVDRWGLACRLMSDDEGRAIEAVNAQLRWLSDGDAARIREACHAITDDDARRVAAAAELHASTARLRRTLDRAYGRACWSHFGFACIPPGLRLPPRPSFKRKGDYATFSPPGWSPIELVKVDGDWKAAVHSWPDVQAQAADEQHRPQLEQWLANVHAMSEIMDRFAANVRAGKYISAADAFGTLNAELHGYARGVPPIVLVGVVDFTTPATQPATCPVPIVELRGDAAEIGQSYARQAGDDIRLLQRDYMGRMLASMGPWFAQGLIRLVAFGKAARFEPLLRPEHLAEIRAMARTLHGDAHEILLAQCFLDMLSGGACSTVALPASASPDHVARFGRNLDFDSLDVLDRHSILLIVHPRDRYAYASITWPGLIGVLSGMNEHGLAVACMEVARPERKPDAMPYMLLYRTLLERCRTVDEAVAFLEQTPRQTANNLMLMDASGARAVAEITPEKVTIRRAPDTAALVSTNHHRGTDLDMPGRCWRFDYLHDAARRQFGQLSQSAVEELLRGSSQAGATLQSMIFEPANRVIYLAVGAGAANHGFARIDLKPYFR